jgi:hypothetical protein
MPAGADAHKRTGRRESSTREITMRQVKAKPRWRKGCLLLGLAAAAMSLTGCASTPTRVDTGAVKARTFNFFDARAESAPPLTARAAEIHGLIQDAIVQELATKGLTKVDKNGDVTLCYMIIVSDGGKTTSYNEFYGYGDSADNLQAKAHQAFVLDNRNRTQYDAGTLVIDVANFRQYEVYFRNFVWSPVMNDLPVEQRKERLKGFVHEVLKPLRVAH